MATIVLIIEILFYLVLCAGVAAQLKKKYHWHDKLQAPVVVLNILVILFVMIPSFRTVVFGNFPANLSNVPTLVTAIHGTLGLIAQGLAIYCFLAGFKILPRKFGVLRYFMWATFAFWTATILFGIGVYILFYTGAGASDGAGPGEHDADLVAEHAEPTGAEAAPGTAEAPVEEAVEEHAEAPVATEEAIAQEPAAEEAVEEHAEAPVATEEAVAQEPAATEEAAEEHAEEVATTEAAGETQQVPATILQGQWQPLQATNEGPSARYQHAMQYSPATNQLFVVGGRNGDRIFDNTWALNPDNLSWQFLADESKSPTAPVLYSSVLIVDNAGQNLYLATGQGTGGQNSNEVWKLDLTTQAWANITASAGSPPAPRYGTGGGNIGNNLVVTHGFGETRYDDTWRLNTTNGQWENITPSGALPIKRCLLASTVSEGDLVINGGCATPDGPCYLDDTWVLDAQTNTWREVLSDVKPAGRQYHTLAAGEPGSNQVVLFGGQGADGAARNDLWILNLETGVWQAVETPAGPTPRYNHTAAWIPDKGMIIFGGQDGSAAFNDMWLLTLQAAAPETAAPTTEPAPAEPTATPVPAPAEPTATPELVSEHDGG